MRSDRAADRRKAHMADDNEDAEMMEVEELGRVERRMGRSRARRIFITALIVMVIGIGIVLIANLRP
jgi:hypothetical protein